MRKILSLILFFILILLVEICPAQKVELTAGVSGNLYNYGGTAAVKDGYYSINTMILSKKLTGGYGANLQLKFVAKDGFMVGVQGGYDVLRSTADIKSLIINPCISCSFNTIAAQAPTQGNFGYKTNASKLINVNPFLGYRVKKRKLVIDITLGADLAYVAEDKNRTVYTEYYNSDQTVYYDRTKLYNISFYKKDVRIKTGVGFWYDRFGLDINYEHGLKDLVDHSSANPYYYTPGSAYSQLLRLGLNYRLL